MRNFILFICLMFLFGCKKDQRRFFEKKVYDGYFYETAWTYTFSPNGTYLIESQGHLGGDPETGSYFIKDSIIVLFSEDENFESWKFNRFKVIGDYCIRNYQGIFFCNIEEIKMEDINQWISDELMIRDSIEQLELTKDEREEWSKKDSSTYQQLRNEGIILKNGNEFYEYELVNWLPEYHRYMVHLRLYVSYGPVIIFDNNFNLIKELKMDDKFNSFWRKQK